MEIKKYWRVLRRRAWIPISLGLAAIMVTGIVASVLKPDYTATASVLVKSQSSNNGAKTLDFQDIALSNTVAESVWSQLNLKGDATSIQSKIQVIGGRSNLYQVSATDTDPQRAAAIANAVADRSASLYTQLAAGTDLAQKLAPDRAIYRDRYVNATLALLSFQREYPDADRSDDLSVRAELLNRQLEQRATEQAYLDFESEVIKAKIVAASNGEFLDAQVVDKAVPKADMLARVIWILFAGAAGLVLGLGLVLALEFLDDSIRRPEDAEQALGAPVLAVIPRSDVRTLRKSEDVSNA